MEAAAEAINAKYFGVHKTSPLRSAEPDCSRTPGTARDLGGSDQEGEAQINGEACFYGAGDCAIENAKCGRSLLLFDAGG